MADSPGADRNLLFGILALQMNFIGRDILIAAMNEWVLDKTRPLGQILADERQLSPVQLRRLDDLIALHLAANDGDPSRSLQAVASVSSVAGMLAPLTDPDVQASVMTIATNDKNGSTGYFHAASDAHGPRYVKLRHHAAGGLGDVFVAEDVELHREVALKEIKKGRADDAASRARFVLEAEVTGGLEHPGVVPVYGLGVFKDGRPYYAMRLIRGESFKAAIDRYHRGEPKGSPSERRLALRELLTRFVAVCNAVAYAHSRGVLHRDLKPANVMLGPYGETLVVDWGLAKTHSAKSPAPSAEEPTLSPASGSISDGTRAGSRLGTAQFMSPEQDAGRLDELGPPSDIYSLGVMLYVLLTGRRPFDDVPVEELSDAVQTGRFPPPRAVRPEVPRGLDAICLRAMALRPTERYKTALELAADVEHWLADEPVSAYAEPLPGRAMRWARHHRTAVASLGVLLATAVVVLSITNGLVYRAERRTEEQKQIAESNYSLARALSVNGVDLIVTNEAKFAADPTSHKARKEILKTAAGAYRKYLEEEPNDPAMRARAALVFRYAANVHRLEHEVGAAEPLYRDGIALYDGLGGLMPDDVRLDSLAGTLHDYASLQANVGKLKDAATSLDRSVAIARELRKEDPQRPGWQLTEAAALLNRAGLEHTRGDFVAAEATANQAAALFRGLDGKSSPYDKPLLAAAVNIIAMSRRDNTTPDAATRTEAARLSRAFGGGAELWAESLRLNRARKAHTDANEIIEKLVKEKPAGINPEDVHYFRARFRTEQAKTMVQVSPKRAAGAELNLGSAATVLENQMKRFPEIPQYRTGLAQALVERGELRAGAGRGAEARADFQRVVDLLAKPAEAEIPPSGTLNALGRAQLGLGRLARVAGNVGDATAAFDAAEATLRRATTLSPDDVHDRRALNDVLAAK